MAQSAGGADTAGPALVVSYLRLGRVSDAQRAAQALLDRDPKNLMAQSLLGTVRMVEGKYSDAAAIFQAIVTRDRTLVGAQRGLAQADEALGKLDDAKSVMQALLKQHPDLVGDQVILAGIEARQKDVASAADRLRKAQKGASADPTPGLALLQMYGEEKAWDKARAYGRELESQFPGNARVISANAALLAAAGDAKGAASEYVRLTQASPNDVDVLLRYADYLVQAGDLIGARTTLENALQANPKSFPIMSRLATFVFDHEGLDKALATAHSFASGRQLASDLISAGLYERAKQLPDAVATLAAAMKRNPQLAVVLQLSNDLFNAGQQSQALEMLRQWIKDHPGDIDAQLVLAQFYQRQSDSSSALRVYEDGYKADPRNWVIANNLAEIYAGTGDPRARALGEQAYYLAPGAPTADTYGWALVRTGDATEGLPFLRKAAAALPSNAIVLYHLAVALKDTGNPAEARDILQKVVGSGAAFDDQNAAKQLLEQLQRG
jgi:putative PEP-CTERM system TPR-repeat lipoprotein